MGDAEIAEVRKAGVLVIKLENDSLDWDVLVAVVGNIFPHQRLAVTLHSSKTGIHIEVID